MERKPSLKAIEAGTTAYMEAARGIAVIDRVHAALEVAYAAEDWPERQTSRVVEVMLAVGLLMILATLLINVTLALWI